MTLADTWLSAITINARHREGNRDVRDLYQMKIRVCATMDGIPEPHNGRLLWSQPKPNTVLIQTGGPVSKLAFPAGYLDGEPWSANVTPKLAALHPGQSINFSVIANPTRTQVKVLGADGVRRKVGGRRWLPLEDRDDWLRIYFRDHGGMQVEDIAGKDLGVKSGIQCRTGHRITHLHHLFTGTATVLDPEQLRTLVRRGVGHGRAFGCGLLVIT